jgi:hypothetical protein
MTRTQFHYAPPDPNRIPSFIQPVSVKEKPDSLWQVADQHGVAMMSFGWHRSALSAHRALKGGDA